MQQGCWKLAALLVLSARNKECSQEAHSVSKNADCSTFDQGIGVEEVALFRSGCKERRSCTRTGVVSDQVRIPDTSQEGTAPTRCRAPVATVRLPEHLEQGEDVIAHVHLGVCEMLCGQCCSRGEQTGLTWSEECTYVAITLQRK